MILSVQNVSFSRKDQSILKDISFTIFPGDFMAIIGPNGGGKSTLLHLIMGLLKPTSGEIKLFNQSVSKGRERVGYLSQFTHWNTDFPISVLEVVLMSTLRKSIFYRPSQADKEHAKNMLKTVGADHLASRPISKLSGGEKQRILLARCLMNNPEFLILDEPTTSVDSSGETSIYHLLSILKQKISILMVSHDITATAQLVNKIGCLNQTLTIHDSGEINPHDLQASYGCSVDILAHGIPHRVLKSHD